MVKPIFSKEFIGPFMAAPTAGVTICASILFRALVLTKALQKETPMVSLPSFFPDAPRETAKQIHMRSKERQYGYKMAAQVVGGPSAFLYLQDFSLSYCSFTSMLSAAQFSYLTSQQSILEFPLCFVTSPTSERFL